MANGTWQEAIACPRCGFTGEEAKGERTNVTKASGGKDVTRGATIHKIYCRNSRCRWYNTNWTVQVNPDGTIPDPNARRPEKKFQPLDPALAATMKNRFETLEENTRRLQQGGEAGEIRNR